MSKTVKHACVIRGCVKTYTDENYQAQLFCCISAGISAQKFRILKIIVVAAGRMEENVMTGAWGRDCSTLTVSSVPYCLSSAFCKLGVINVLCETKFSWNCTDISYSTAQFICGLLNHFLGMFSGLCVHCRIKPSALLLYCVGPRLIGTCWDFHMLLSLGRSDLLQPKRSKTWLRRLRAYYHYIAGYSA